MAARNRLWVLGSVVTMVVIGLLAWFIGIQPQLASVASVNAQRVSVEAQNAIEQGVLDRLEADAANADALMASWKLASSSVPTGTGVPRFIDQLHDLAADTGVAITRITVSDAAPFQPAVPAAGAATEGAATDGTATDGTATEGTAGSVSAPASTGGLDASNFAYLQVSIEVTGEYSRILDFVNGLQTGERLMLVNDLEASAEVADASVDAEGVRVEQVSTGYTARIGGSIFSLVDAGRTASTQAEVGPSEAAGGQG